MGALCAGVYEAVRADDAFAAAATIGFTAMFVVPVLFLVGIAARGAAIAWQPRAIAARLTEANGAAPKLAAWVAVAWLAFAGLYWGVFQLTWMMAAWTAFKPLPVSLAEPVIGALVIAIAFVLAKPVARLLEHLARKLAARRPRLLRPRVIFATFALLTVAGLTAVWLIFLRTRVSPDWSSLVAPALAVAGAIAYRGWRIVGWIASALVAVAIAVALLARFGSPEIALAVWGDRPFAGLAVDLLFDIDAIRAETSIPAPLARPGAAHPDIVLITVDSLRADRMPPYTGQIQMPVFNELGQRGLVFEWAFAASNSTRRGLPAIVTGLNANRLRGHATTNAMRLDPRHVMLAERLAAGGYQTAGFVCCEDEFAAHTGLERGLSHLEISTSGAQTGQRAAAWLDARTDPRPLFVWIHLMEPRDWQQAAGEPRTDEDRARAYAASLSLVDAALVSVFGAFAKRPPERAPIVIAVGDHGEGLGDHGQLNHGTDLYNPQIRVPMIIAGPGITPGRTYETASVVDLAPTILDLAGFTPPKLDGRDLAPLATGARQSQGEGGLAFVAMIPDGTAAVPGLAMIRGSWKLIEVEGRNELFNYRNDLIEAANQMIVPRMGSLAAELRALAQQRLDAGHRSQFR